MRLFKSVPEELRRHIIAAEFEPGIIDSYHGEDKLWKLLQFMNDEPFWCSAFNVLGNRRISPNALKYFSRLQQRLLYSSTRLAPGWAEVSFLNDFSGADLDVREYLLGWVFAMIQEQYGAALNLAERAKMKFEEPLFEELLKVTVKKLKRDCVWSKRLFAALISRMGRGLRRGVK